MAPRRVFSATMRGPRDAPRREVAHLSPGEAQLIEAWRLGYNQRRPYGSLGRLTPIEFIAQPQAMRAVEAVAVSS